MLISQTIIYNEKNRFLLDWLNNNHKYFDKMVIYDDASTDGTPEYIEEWCKINDKDIQIISEEGTIVQDDKFIILFKSNKNLFKTNEVEIRSRLWKLVRCISNQENNDWVFTLDSDEFITEKFIEEKYRIMKSNAKCVNFKKIELWNETEYRIDGLWSNYFNRMFVYEDKDFGFDGNGYHLPCLPYYILKYNSNTEIYKANTRIIHKAYMTEELRNDKLKFMDETDTKKDFNYTHIKTIVDRKPVLKDINSKQESCCLIITLDTLYKIPQKLIDSLHKLEYYGKLKLIFFASYCNPDLYKTIEDLELPSIDAEFKIINYLSKSNVIIDVLSYCYDNKNEYDYFCIHNGMNDLRYDLLNKMVNIEGKLVLSETPSPNTILIHKDLVEKFNNLQGLVINNWVDVVYTLANRSDYYTWNIGSLPAFPINMLDNNTVKNFI